MNATDSRPTAQAARWPARPGAAAWVVLASRPFNSILRAPLFLKLFLGHTLVVGALGAACVYTNRSAVAAGLPPASLEGFVMSALVLSGLVSAAVVRLALSPLARLEEAARRVRRGDLAARAPASPLADAEFEGVIDVFNQALDGVEADRARQAELSLRVLQAEERERERIARDLYAGTAQTLAGVLVRIRVAERRKDSEHSRSTLEEVRTEVAGALDEVCRMARQLRPPELDELGVVAALEAHVRYLTDARPVRVSFEGQVDEASLGPDTALALLRIVQEALANAILHSGGTRVKVSFRPVRATLEAKVEDDGKGFDADRALFEGAGGLGLLGMRERAGYVGGTLVVESAPGRGTRVRLTVPRREGGGEQAAGASPNGVGVHARSIESPNP